MNDYKELVAKFRAKKNDGWQKDGSYQEQIITVQDILDAADAIEQLARDNNVLTKERDAAVADLEHLMHTYAGSVCFYCKHYNDRHCDDCVLGDKWQWRGAQEVDDG